MAKKTEKYLLTNPVLFLYTPRMIKQEVVMTKAVPNSKPLSDLYLLLDNHARVVADMKHQIRDVIAGDISTDQKLQVLKITVNTHMQMLQAALFEIEKNQLERLFS